MFEGYVGIRLWSGQLMEDVWFSILFVLFFLFAIHARIHVKSFIKIFRNLGFNTSGKSSNTDLSIYYSKSLHFYLIFQALALSSLAITQEAYYLGFLNNIDKEKLLLVVVSTFLSVLVFYLIRRIIYYLLIYTFSRQDVYRQWVIIYNSLISVWGISLYLPVIGMSFLGNYHFWAVCLFIIFYILFRFAIIYKSIRLFYIKKFDLFYLSLYLCAHEILPLLIAYKGFVFLYNFIEKSALWH